ncbi:MULTISPECIES: TetR/AcrR family transcriptional regulator [Mycobacteriaceae]|uniref:TetR family transcriptional regulator n=1 Tax=Mycolicibacterium neoaurum VKM Ac-1815D TaxID=700508 RepID=V5XGI2_MYCNE|nr:MULTISPECIES: TetR/AcrR family transcriptional regulator [Mycobacteriaceae]AHC27107.1 TetR family transcriptional regulator [Mycolicibacterium neoaurum VKM Ac-1815D]AMO07371.1 TetR family transcriptional regulator [Mycolicibacterium neoaurum]AXK74245.1 TetR/AcrR family transcriptional regulator [Mycolicibacterium neoaurum]KJQ51326.1 TetR family transcriptional regulator [Mycolicibacterium neoaurum]KUM09362.1 TetR family transcriptional regulator [Mycolicibacterium neoaurum]
MTQALRRTRGRPRAANGAETRERIIFAARQVFSELGYDASTFQEIAERADLTRPAINHYFSNKRDLYQNVLDTTHTGLIEAGIAAAAGQSTLLDKLTALMSGMLAAHRETDSAAAFLVTSMLEAHRHPELKNDEYAPRDGIRTFLADAVSDAIANGELTDETDGNSLIEMLLVLMFGMGFYAGFVGTDDEVAAVIDRLRRLLSNDLWALREPAAS